SCIRLVRSMHSVAVKLTGCDIWQVSMPDILCTLWQGDALGLAAAFLVEETEFDLAGIRGEQREIRTIAVPRRAQRMGQAGRQTAVSARGRNKGRQAVG